MECKNPMVGEKLNKLDELINQLKKVHDDGCAKSDIEKLNEMLEKLDNIDDKLVLIFHEVFFGDVDIVNGYKDKISFLEEIRENVIKEIFENHKYKYGNHRKFCAKTYKYYGDAIRSFLDLLPTLKNDLRNDTSFDALYNKIIKKVYSFGRTATWDFIEIIDRTILNGKLRPTKMYLRDSTGPKNGVQYFFEVHTIKDLKQKKKLDLEEAGMEILNIILNSDKISNKIKKDRFLIYRLEDALCIFQKGKFQSGT
jgi:hypothetical protein